MIQQVRPAIVRIETNTSTGSGAIFDTQGQTGYVITNHHVIEDASQVTVIVNDSSRYPGTVLGSDPTRDLAVVRICCAQFTTLPFGDASRLKAGDEIIAIGYAIGLPGQATVTRGIISAIRYDQEYRTDVIQTDAAINPGNSGGPMLSTDGKILGINTFGIELSQSGRPLEGLNFAISGTTVQQLIPSLRTASPRPTPNPTRRPTPAPTPTYRNGTADFGPLNGELRHDPSDGLIEIQSAGVSMSDMMVEATFVNPYSAASGDWDYGFFIRDSGTGESLQSIEFTVTSRGYWEAAWRKGTSNQSQEIASGRIRNLNTGAGDRNHLQVVAIGERGWFFVNNQFVSAIDLSEITGTGDVAVGTGFYEGDEMAGAVTRFEDFQGNRLTHSYGPASGVLEHEPGQISGHDSGAWSRNFVAEAEFTNPPGNAWDYGFIIRNPEYDRLDVIALADDRQWFHYTSEPGDADYTTVDRGRISAGNFRNSNHLLLIAIEEIGLLFVNGQLISQLDLSRNLDHGYVTAMGGFFNNHTGEPEFQNFNLWTP